MERIKQMVFSLMSLFVGCLLIFFRSTFAHKVVEQQNRFWDFGFGESAVKVTEIVSLIVGIAFSLVGLISLIQTLRLR
jgi:hypothetical protein